MLADPQLAAGEGSARLRMCVSAGEALPEHIGTQLEEAFRRRHSRRRRLDRNAAHLPLQSARRRSRYGTPASPCPATTAARRRERHASRGGRDRRACWCAGPSAATATGTSARRRRRTFEGDWTRTGDKYTRDADGCYRYCGRTDDMFKVERAVGVAVRGRVGADQASSRARGGGRRREGRRRPDEAEGVRRAQERRWHATALEAELKEHVKARVGPWKYPRWIEFVDSLPKTATGKIQRFKLRARA